MQPLPVPTCVEAAKRLAITRSPMDTERVVQAIFSLGTHNAPDQKRGWAQGMIWSHRPRLLNLNVGRRGAGRKSTHPLNYAVRLCYYLHDLH
jgi:hypothetical protein